MTQSFCPVSDPAFSQTLTFLLSLTTISLMAVPEFSTVHTVAQVHNLGTIFFFLRMYLLFLAVLGLHCCVWAFSSYGEWGYSHGAQASRCGGFSWSTGSRADRLQELQLVGSRALAQ